MQRAYISPIIGSIPISSTKSGLSYATAVAKAAVAPKVEHFPEEEGVISSNLIGGTYIGKDIRGRGADGGHTELKPLTRVGSNPTAPTNF